MSRKYKEHLRGDRYGYPPCMLGTCPGSLEVRGNKIFHTLREEYLTDKEIKTEMCKVCARIAKQRMESRAKSKILWSKKGI